MVAHHVQDARPSRVVAPHLARVILIVVLAYAGGTKLLWPEQIASAWWDAGIVPESVVWVLAYVLPALELGIAVVVAVGWFPFAANAVALFMSMMFFGIHVFAYLRGDLLPCTCLGASYLSFDQMDEHLFMMVVSLLMLISSLVLMRHESRRRVTSR